MSLPNRITKKDVQMTMTGGRKRHSYTDAERKELRSWYRQREVEGLVTDHTTARNWFTQRFQKPINQTAMSRVLSSKYDYLDEVELGRPNLTRLRKSTWPELEVALFQYYQTMCAQKQPFSGGMLQKKAKDLFSTLPQYQGQEPPKFSNGWIDGFKKRYGIQMRRRTLSGSVESGDEQPARNPSSLAKISDFSVDEVGRNTAAPRAQSNIHQMIHPIDRPEGSRSAQWDPDDALAQQLQEAIDGGSVESEGNGDLDSGDGEYVEHVSHDMGIEALKLCYNYIQQQSWGAPKDLQVLERLQRRAELQRRLEKGVVKQKPRPSDDEFPRHS